MGKSHYELDFYEQGIVGTLASDFGYGPQKALEKYLEYKKVFDCLDRYDNPEDHARYLDSAIKRGISADAWLAHIDKSKGKVSKNQNSQLLEERVQQLESQVAILSKSMRNLKRRSKSRCVAVATTMNGHFVAKAHGGLASGRKKVSLRKA